ncbi:MAG: helix-turn-helix domain-containing protein [Bacteroidota bacterium]
MPVPHQHIIDLINEGEHQQLDFKFEISDSKKIARSLVAFSNTDGGRLLIGVKDNGVIAGIRSDEEYYMMDAAATMYCKPPVNFSTQHWEINGKSVLEVIVPQSENKPHAAPDKTGKYMVYVRVKDENRLANRTLIKVWQQQKKSKGVLLEFTAKEKRLLSFLEEHERISFTKIRKILRVSAYKAEDLLVKLISMNILAVDITDKGIYYRLNFEGPE